MTELEDTAAYALADLFGRYLHNTADWQRQAEIWESMKTEYEVHAAQKSARATQRLQGMLANTTANEEQQ